MCILLSLPSIHYQFNFIIMKTLTSKNLRNAFLFSCTLFAFLFLSSCARKLTFATSAIAPAATGTVKIKKTSNGNYSVNLETRHLAPADKLSPPRRVYVVWMQTEQNPVRNIGMLKSETGFLSKTLKGNLQATATSKPTSFFITAEDDGNVQYPGNEVVLRTR